MKKAVSILLSISLVITLLVGCTNNKQTNKTVGGSSNQSSPQADSVKTGLAVLSSASSSKDAADSDGIALMDSSIVAVTVDKNGKIVKCVIDGIRTTVNFSNAGKIITPKDTKFKTKLELGTEYGMKKASSIGKEWSEQANALATYVVGKTADEVKGIAVNEKGAATATELKSSVTFSIGNYIDAIVKAVSNAQDIGAKASDKLGFSGVTNIAKSLDATDKEGLAQAYSIYSAVTFDANDKITSCIFDGSQTNVKFDSKGKITSDIKASVKTKNELGTEYGMKKASSIGKEWNEEAASFAKYVIGKTVSEVKGIAINEKGAPIDSELKSSVTVSVGDFLTAIEKAKGMAK